MSSDWEGPVLSHSDQHLWPCKRHTNQKIIRHSHGQCPSCRNTHHTSHWRWRCCNLCPPWRAFCFKFVCLQASECGNRIHVWQVATPGNDAYWLCANSSLPSCCPGAPRGQFGWPCQLPSMPQGPGQKAPSWMRSLPGLSQLVKHGLIVAKRNKSGLEASRDSWGSARAAFVQTWNSILSGHAWESTTRTSSTSSKWIDSSKAYSCFTACLMSSTGVPVKTFKDLRPPPTVKWNVCCRLSYLGSLPAQGSVSQKMLYFHYVQTCQCSHLKLEVSSKSYVWLLSTYRLVWFPSSLSPAMFEGSPEV